MTLEKSLRPGLFSLGMGLEKIVDGFQQNSDPPQIQSPVCDGAPVAFGSWSCWKWKEKCLQLIRERNTALPPTQDQNQAAEINYSCSSVKKSCVDREVQGYLLGVDDLSLAEQTHSGVYFGI